MTAPLDPFRQTAPEQRRTRVKIEAGHGLAEIRAAATHERERLSAIVAGLGVTEP